MTEGVGDQAAHLLLQRPDESCRGLSHGRRVWDQFPGKTESRTVQKLSWSGVCIFSPSRADSKEDNWQFVHPCWALEPGPEGFLQMSMETFNDAVGLRVIGGGRLMLNTEGRLQLCPQSTGELGPTIRHHMIGDPEPRDPMTYHGSGTRSGGSIRDWYRLGPSRETVDDCKQVGLALGRWKGAYQVDVNAAEPPVRRREVLQWCFDMSSHFGRLAGMTLSAPLPDVPPHASPNKTI